MDWINLAQDKGQWRVLVNMVTDRWVPYNAGAQLGASQEGLNSIKLITYCHVRPCISLGG
jgi:hypothetical protein